MKRKLGLVMAMAAMLVAATPAGPPIITLEGLAAATKLSPASKTAIAPHVTALNASLEVLVAYHKANPNATHEQMMPDLKALHEAMLPHHDAIMANIDPSQHAACFKYLHEQLKAAGLEHILGEHMKHMRHGTHGHTSGGGHGG